MHIPGVQQDLAGVHIDHAGVGVQVLAVGLAQDVQGALVGSGGAGAKLQQQVSGHCCSIRRGPALGQVVWEKDVHNHAHNLFSGMRVYVDRLQMSLPRGDGKKIATNGLMELSTYPGTWP